MSYRILANRCPACGYPYDAVTIAAAPGTPTPAPRPGDVFVCIDCAHPMIRTRGGAMREPRGREIAELARDPDIKRAKAAIAALTRRPH